MKVRCRNSHPELKHVRTGMHFVTNLHWSIARRLLRELRDLTDLEFAELYTEADAERVRRLGPRADLDFPCAMVTEETVSGYLYSDAFYFSVRERALVFSPNVSRCARSTCSASRLSAGEVYVNSAFRMSGTGVYQSPHLAAGNSEQPAAEGSRQQARQRTRAARRHGTTVR